MAAQDNIAIPQKEVPAQQDVAALNLSSEPRKLPHPTLDMLLLLMRAKKVILAWTGGALMLGVCAALLLRPTFTGVATIMPPQAPQSSLSSLMGQLGSLSALGGGAGGLLKNPADLYVGVLQSRSVTDRLIEQFHLEAQWHEKTMEDTRKKLAKYVQFEVNKNGLIVITVKDHNAQQAGDMANFFVDALNGMDARLAIGEAAQRRLFFERQMAEEKDALAKAEEDLKRVQQRTGLLTLNGQTDLAVRSVAQMRAEISTKEVELRGLRTYDSDENPDVMRAQNELGTLQGQLRTLEDNEAKLAPGDTQIAANQVPAGSLEYARSLREVRYHDTLMDLLSRQYEAARIDEAKSAPIIQVVDRAVTPDKRSGPPRVLIILGCGLLGFLAACSWVFSLAAINRARRTPEIARKMDELYGQLRW